MEGLASQGIEAIVVGIANIGARRFNEYIPFPAPDLQDAQGDLYVSFIADTLKPMIDRDFRTQPDRTTTGIMGSSLGGLISLYAFFKRSDTFGLAGVVSPALRWGKQGIFPFVTQAATAPGRIYIDVGTAEGTGLVADPQSQRSFADHYVQQVRRMNNLLRRKGYRAGQSLLYVEEEGGVHHESAWARRLPAALRFLLGNPL
jgi:predicted alpha/beta superfamily hydrolase